MHPPTPRSTPSPSATEDKDDSTSISSHQRKRQRTGGGPSSPPLTPPRSSPASPVPESPTATTTLTRLNPRSNFNSLPAELKRAIIFEFVAVSVPPFPHDYTRTYHEPRRWNEVLLQLLRRRRILTAAAAVNSFWRACIEPLLSSGPRLVVSMGELGRLAGNEHQIPDKTPMRPIFHQTILDDFQPRDARFLRRRKVKRSASQDVPEVICWMACLPWRKDHSEVGQRWPRWYILDCMRYDLEDLRVKKLAVLAANQATLADTLHATIPNHDTITQLHLEVRHQIGATTASDDRFENVYRHCPETQHLCQRLLFHRDTLESLSFRNVAICAALAPYSFPRLKNLDAFWVNNLPGLCLSHDYDETARHEVYSLREELCAIVYNRPDVRLWIALAFDRSRQGVDMDQWMQEYRLLLSSHNGSYWFNPRANTMLEELVEGAPYRRFDSDYSDDYEWIDDEEEEEDEEEEDEDDDEIFEVQDDRGGGKGRAIPRAGHERRIAPAPQTTAYPGPMAYPVLKIR